eukprot:5123109-Lingulodinium_polyedra.AAC.1
MGYPVGDVRAGLQPLWRVLRAWHLALPQEFRKPVPHQLARALGLYGMTHGHLDFAVVVLLSHHALLRPDEAQSLL